MAGGIDALETLARKIFTKVGRPWAWDERFRAMLLTIDVADKPILADITAILGKGLKSSDIAAAPERIRELADAAGGLDAGQWLLHSTNDEGPILYATVWPWGNGKTISVRVSYYSPKLADADRPAANAELKAWFGA